MNHAPRSASRVAVYCLLFAAAAGCERGASLGQRIYQEGVGINGPLAYTQGPDWLRFAAAGCAVCHGARGQGLSMQAGEAAGAAPAVHADALAARGYDQASLRRALMEGMDLNGREFSYYMPRWELTDAEFDALAAHLQSL